MHFMMRNEILLWVVFVLVVTPLCAVTFISNIELSFSQRWCARITFGIFVYMFFIYYIIQGGSSF